MSKNKYKNLLSNTVIFAIGTFSTKLLVLFMFPIYTKLLTPAENGTISLIVNTSNFILPIMYASISEAIIRFGLDKAVKKADVYTTGILTLARGYIVLWLLFPLLKRIPNVNDYIILVYIYVLTSALRTITTHFVRALGHVKLFALDGMFTTVLTVAFNLLFLMKFKLGINGYVMATILADLVSAVSLTLIAGTWRYFNLKTYDKSIGRQMLKYSLPLIPTSIFWWITNLSDKYIVAYYLGVDETGIYDAAGKLPMIITMVSSIFIQAWQLSAFTEYDSKEGERFYSNVFKGYYTLIFMAASGIFMLIKPIMSILDKSYYEGWRYAPFLILGVSFSCFVTFLGTIYNAAKENTMVTITTAIGAALNIVLNILWVPLWGAQGAAFATFLSYILVFIIRAIHSRKYMKLDLQPIRMLLNITLLLIQAWVLLAKVPKNIMFQIIIFLALMIVNSKQLLFLLRQVMGALYRYRHGHKRKN